MTGYWKSEYSSDELRTRDDVRDLIDCEVDAGNDNDEFGEWLADQDDRIVTDFIDSEGYCNDLYEELKDEFVDKETDEMWACRGEDYELFGNTYVWHEDIVLTTLEIEIHTTVTFNAKEVTKEQAIAELFPHPEKLSMIIREVKNKEESE